MLNHAETFVGPEKNRSDHVASNAVIDIEHLSCRGQSLLSDLNIAHMEGTQQISHRISDPQPLPDRKGQHLDMEAQLSFYKNDTTRK
jgi:hypothetical protein